MYRPRLTKEKLELATVGLLNGAGVRKLTFLKSVYSCSHERMKGLHHKGPSLFGLTALSLKNKNHQRQNKQDLYQPRLTKREVTSRLLSFVLSPPPSLNARELHPAPPPLSLGGSTAGWRWGRGSHPSLYSFPLALLAVDVGSVVWSSVAIDEKTLAFFRAVLLLGTGGSASTLSIHLLRREVGNGMLHDEGPSIKAYQACSSSCDAWR